MSSGFYEIEGGTQPALPALGHGRLFFDTAANVWKVLFADGSSKVVTLPAPTAPDQVPVWNGSSWVSAHPKFNPKVTTEVMEDWAANTAAGVLNWDADTASGGNVTTTQAFPISTDVRYGKVRYRISAANGSRAGHDRGFPDISIGNGELCAINSNWFSTDFFQTTNNNVYRTGFGNSGSDQTGLTQTDGVYFQITRNGVFAKCEDGGITTTEDMGIVLLSERWYRFEILVNSAGTSANFKVYETLDNAAPTLMAEVNVTTNLPPSSAQIGLFNQLKADSAGSGNTNNDVWQDYFYFKRTYNFER